MMTTSYPVCRHVTALVAVVVLGLLVGLGSAGAQLNSVPDQTELWIEPDASDDGVDGPESPYAELVDTVGPAVVNVLVSFDDDDLPPHARMPGPTPDHRAEGSGFIIHPDGYVVTNFHVIDNAQAVTVRLDDDTELDAEVIGGDPMTDVALMKVDSDDELPTVTLGDSAGLSVGDYVVAIGNPLGLSHTVTSGIISALDRRNLPIEGREHQGNFIQIDAPINPGNSGGPLIDINGRIIGINTAINREGQGISFAIPVNLLKTLLPQLAEDGYIDRSWLGVRIQPLDHMLAQSFDLDDSSGALVTEVLDDSPASRAGIEERDVIVGVDGRPVDNSDDLPLIVSMLSQESDVPMAVIRNGERLDIDVELESLPDQSRPELPDTESDAVSAHHPLGIEVEEMTERSSRQLDAPRDSGVVVTSLTDYSPARHAGVQDRDVVVEVDSRPVGSESEFREAIEETDADSVIRLKLLRDGRTVYKAFSR